MYIPTFYNANRFCLKKEIGTHENKQFKKRQFISKILC